ncbi:beta family protein [Bifidobacterium bombi]|uniref:Phage beta protein n=1 Tax=Bifidobacterium bombi DSM 19703 TaxID=1341695 RepID=A0A086BNE4_9BIFI|nr:hypothetical protein [Bifidobacterium bombi]KFF30458.1 phage beta protein [Bifidobacterium bombi DSM 19703]
MQLTEHCYVPRLLVKKGEMDALFTLFALRSADSLPQNTEIYPLLEIPGIDWDYENDRPSDKPNSFIDKKAEQIFRTWPAPAFLDAAEVVTDLNGGGQSIPLIEPVLNKFRSLTEPSLSTRFIPVLHDVKTNSTAYQQVKALVRKGVCIEVCLRLRSGQWKSLTDQQNFRSWLSGLGLKEEDCHIILDLESNVDENAFNALQIVLFTVFLALYPKLDFAVLGTAIPETSDIHSALDVVTRDEWVGWLQMMTTARGEHQNLPIAFGDYGTVGLRSSTDVDPKIMNISGKFKYTVDDSWLIGKGGLFKGRKNMKKIMGGQSILPVVNAIVNDQRFLPQHCETDEWMKQLSTGANTKFGSPTTWITKAMQHHMLTVLQQL